MSTPLRIACIAGARPNFMKIAPITRALEGSSLLEGVIVHTGQHYDAAMSDVFFRELGIPEPLINLGVGSGSHGRQTGQIMIAFEDALREIDPHLVLVVGDVNSTIACALVAKKQGVPVAHVEAGLRSRDRSMPEEINRVLTDQISDLLFTTEEEARQNLLREGISDASVHFVGNTMIDTLAYMLPHIRGQRSSVELSARPGYGVVTFHRPSNVDRPEMLRQIVDLLLEVSTRIPIVFPAHPRTRARLDENGWLQELRSAPGLHLLDPLSYTEFIRFVKESRFVLTDSGGIQEETTWLGIPCLTQRTSTERPCTVTLGTNTLLGEDVQATRREIAAILDGRYKKGQQPPLWDGHCAERIVAVLERVLPELCSFSRTASAL